MNKSERVRAALSYVFVLFLLPLADRQSEFCQFHAKQGLLLFLTWVLVSFVSWIPLIGGLAVLSMLVVNVIAIVKTLKGEKWSLPFLGQYAQKINW
jgi:uncharacterized membrane protein